MSDYPRIVRGLRRPQWSVFEPSGEFVAIYPTRKRAREWMWAAGFRKWAEESWEQRACTGTPRSTRQIVRIV